VSWDCWDQNSARGVEVEVVEENIVWISSSGSRRLDLGGSGSDLEQGGGGVGRWRREECGDAEEMETGGS
jgi:hypothetical protein